MKKIPKKFTLNIENGYYNHHIISFDYTKSHSLSISRDKNNYSVLNIQVDGTSSNISVEIDGFTLKKLMKSIDDLFKFLTIN